MATFIAVIKSTFGGQQVQLTRHYNALTLASGNVAAPSDLAAEIIAEVMPAYEGITPTQMMHDSVYVRDLGSPGTAVEVAYGNAGNLIIPDATLKPPWNPLHFKETAGAWFDVVTNTAYTGVRPGRAGGFYLSGLSDDWDSLTGASVPGALAVPLETFLDALLEPLDILTATYTCIPVLYTDAKAALGSLPARNPLIAQISGIVMGQFTRLKSRQP